MSTLKDLVGADGRTGLEVIEIGMRRDLIAALGTLAPRVRRTIAISYARWPRDCWVACDRWAPLLKAEQIGFLCADGRGDGPDVFGPDRLTVPESERGGYLANVNDVCELKRHRWFLIGPGRCVFDPTAHQFDQQGGVSLDRYRLDGFPIIEWRARALNDELPSHAVETRRSCE